SFAWLFGVRRGQAAAVGPRGSFPTGRLAAVGSDTCKRTILAESDFASSPARLTTELEAFPRSIATRSVFLVIGVSAEKASLARLFLINLRFVECFRLDDCQGSGVSIKLLKEAAVVSRVAGSAGLLDLEEQYVAIAVGKPALNLLGMAAGLALEPELFS